MLYGGAMNGSIKQKLPVINEFQKYSNNRRRKDVEDIQIKYDLDK